MDVFKKDEENMPAGVCRAAASAELMVGPRQTGPAAERPPAAASAAAPQSGSAAASAASSPARTQPANGTAQPVPVPAWGNPRAGAPLTGREWGVTGADSGPQAASGLGAVARCATRVGEIRESGCG